MTEYLPRKGTKLARGRAAPLCVLASLAAIVCLAHRRRRERSAQRAGGAGRVLEAGEDGETLSVTALVGFNVGVELGQLSVVLAAWILLRHWFARPWYRARVVLPVSFLIAVTGSWWAIQRIFLT